MNLLFSKTRIAPRQKMSIHRLKLLALLIGTRSLNFVSKELKLSNTKKTVWADLQCVLNWIKTKKQLPVFVQNKITKITSKKNIQFCYIHTKENPVDLSSRRLSSNELKGNNLWWKGHLPCSRTRMVEAQSNIMANMEHVKVRRKNT